MDGGSKDNITNTGACALITNSGGLYVESGVQLRNNSSSGNNRGLGIYGASGSATTFQGRLTNIAGTRSGTHGSAILVNGAAMIIRDALIDDNSTNGSGIIQVTGGGSLTMENSTFQRNTASGNGGVLYVDNNKDSSGNANQVTVDGCAFTGNTATGSGGAIA